MGLILSKIFKSLLKWESRQATLPSGVYSSISVFHHAIRIFPPWMYSPRCGLAFSLRPCRSYTAPDSFCILRSALPLGSSKNSASWIELAGLVPAFPGQMQRIDQPRQVPALTEPGEGGQDLLLVHLHHPEVLRLQVRDNRVVAVWKPILPVPGRQRGRVLSPYQPDGVLYRVGIYRGGEDAVPHPDPYSVIAKELIP